MSKEEEIIIEKCDQWNDFIQSTMSDEWTEYIDSLCNLTRQDLFHGASDSFRSIVLEELVGQLSSIQDDENFQEQIDYINPKCFTCGHIKTEEEKSQTTELRKKFEKLKKDYPL